MKKQSKRIVSATVVAVLVLALVAGVVLFYFWIRSVSGISLIFPIALSIIYVFPVVGIIIALIQRIKEIKGGEEDEAAKY